ncbi:MAG: phenylacetate--CoA ligase family protein [Bacillota bacterium]|nr:phenylacetate--CoA ligase family protein [Bacillota bacterium]
MDIVKTTIEKALYPLMERHRGNHIREYISELKDNEKLSRAGFEALREKKLKALLAECAQKVPAYKGIIDCGKNPFESLKKIPPLSKKEYMKAPDLYLNDTAKKENLIANLTGGSTSEPVRFFMDRKTVEYYEAARWRGLSWYGITPGSRSVMVWGSPIELSRLKDKRHILEEKYLKNRIVIPAYALMPDNAEQYVGLIDSYRPEYIYGYSSALYALASIFDKRNISPKIRLKAVVSTSETLFDFQREKLSKVFSCPVADEYGARDGGIIAYECPGGGKHITAENTVLEVVDPISLEPLETGKTGLLLVTDLNNAAMPRLRYILGDMAAIGDTACDCQMGMPLLKELSGRVDDMFVSKDGRLIHGHAFNHIARNLTAIAKFQIRQLSPDRAVLLYVVNDKASRGEIDVFLDGVRGLLPGCQIDIRETAEIPVEKSGKFRYAIREFDL